MRFAQVQDLTDSPAPASFSTTMPKVNRRGRKSNTRRGTVKKSKAVIRKGRVHIKLSKNNTVALAPSQLVQYMPLNKMKRAAKSILRQSSVKVKRRRKSKKN